LEVPLDNLIYSKSLGIAGREVKQHYKVGDEILVKVKASRNCYLTLLNIGTGGKKTVLFPNKSHSDNAIAANTWYEIPASRPPTLTTAFGTVTAFTIRTRL
jgi:hypothetical protein